MERQSKGSRDLEAYCKGGRGPPRAVAPPKKKGMNSKLSAITACPIGNLKIVDHMQSVYIYIYIYIYIYEGKAIPLQA